MMLFYNCSVIMRTDAKWGGNGKHRNEKRTHLLTCLFQMVDVPRNGFAQARVQIA